MLSDEQLIEQIRDELREELSHFDPTLRPPAQLWQDARARPSSRRSIIPRRRRGSHHTHVLRGLAVGLAVLPAVAVAAVAVILLGHAPTHVRATGTSASKLAASAPQQPNVPPAEWPYLQAAQRATVARDPACSTSAAGEPIVSHASPGRTLLGTVGVLRQPRTAADALPQPLSQSMFAHGLGPTREVFVNDIRRARSVLGATYYIIPAGNILGLRPVPGRCTREEIAALNRELPRLPNSLRAETMSLQVQYLAWQRYTAAHPQGIALAVTVRNGGGGIAAGYTVADIDRGMAGLGQGGLAIGTGSGRRVFGGDGLHGIVPDGVATVTLHYPGRSPNSRPRSITVRVFNNMFVAADSARQFPHTISWYSAGGQLIKTVTLPHM